MTRYLPYLTLALAAIASVGEAKEPGLEHRVKATDLPEIITSTSVRYNPVGLLLIDMQAPFLRNIDNYEQKRQLPNILRVLEYAGQHKIPVIVLEYYGEGPTVPILKEKLETLTTEVLYLQKNHNDGFKDTELADLLEERKIKTVVLMGINATACVKATGEGAIRSGLKIVTSTDLIANPPDSWISYENGLEGSRWYRKYGILARNHQELLRKISRRKVIKPQ